MMDKGDKIRSGSFQEHVINKSMWKGAAQPTDCKEWVLKDGKFTKKKICYSPAFLKLIDEILVNACDHWWESRSSKYPVKSIQIVYDKNTGQIVIYNSGAGFPITKMPDGTWKPQAAATKEFTGSNLDNDDNRVVGGTNGLGMKIVSILSNLFIIETVDPIRGKYYYQEFKNNINDIEPPIVLPINDPSLDENEKKPHTRIDFDPDYVKLGYSKYTKKIGEEVEPAIILRAYQVATFINTMGGGCSVRYNGNLINTSLEEFSKMFPINDVVKIELPHEKFPWYLAVGVKSTPKFESHSVINGIYARDGGHHIGHLSREIYRGLTEKVGKILRDFGIEQNPDEKKHDEDLKHYVMDHIFLFMFGQIGNPQWTGQSKEKLSMRPTLLNERKLSEKSLNKIWSVIKPYIELGIAERKGKQKRPKSNKPKLEKYKPAKQSGKARRSNKCYLFLPEGDSAQLLIEKMFSAKGSRINSSYYGIYNVRGVPINVRKKVRNITAGGKSVRIISDKVNENEIFQGLMEVLGLDYDKTYKTDAEFRKLKYDHIIIAVDQDHDGVGQINGLIVNMFATLWPALINRGFILRWETPIIRAFSKKKIGNNRKAIDFYSDSEYEGWSKTVKLSDWNIHYYKGLSAHQPAEAAQMARVFHEHLIGQKWDDHALEAFEIFYGNRPDERKTELCKPVISEAPPSKSITCSYLLNYYVKLFQLSVIERKVPHIQDGLASVHRKILAGARLIPKSKPAMKTYQFGGHVATTMNYHHGDASINKAISYMCQCFTGAKNMPLLQGLGQFGSVQEGTKKFGSPRYTNVRPNYRLTDILFPPIDDWLLPYNFDDGKRCEPEYYSPIVPYAILEHFTTTSVGWKIDIYARDFNKVLTNVKRMINNEELLDMESDLWLPQKYDMDGEPIANQMSVRMAYSSSTAKEPTPHCFGKYRYIKKWNIIKITELPIRNWTIPYVKKLEEKKEKYVESVDAEIQDTVNITVKLKSGALEKIMDEYGDETTDPIEHYLELKQNLSKNLNFVDEDGKVLCCDNYAECIKKWFPTRRKLYEERLKREIILTELNILYYKNIIKYWNDVDSGKIIVPKSADTESLCNQLRDNKYDKFNLESLKSPKYTPTSELKDKILSSNASYNYIINEFSPRYMTKMAQKKRINKLEELENKLKELLSTTWKTIWLKELEDLAEIVKEGTRTSWLFGEGNIKW